MTTMLKADSNHRLSLGTATRMQQQPAGWQMQQPRRCEAVQRQLYRTSQHPPITRCASAAERYATSAQQQQLTHGERGKEGLRGAAMACHCASLQSMCAPEARCVCRLSTRRSGPRLRQPAEPRRPRRSAARSCSGACSSRTLRWPSAPGWRRRPEPPLRACLRYTALLAMYITFIPRYGDSSGSITDLQCTMLVAATMSAQEK